MPNRLATETSPYLRQHADNPVDWFAWGDDAFDIARASDRPIFCSIGYASCHWCHVMAHESFEDPEIAALLNEEFVNVKVDREERPDVDAIYMDATQALTGHGGWPMSVWLTPRGRPFYAGTYFPPTDRPGMPSFRSVCEAVAQAWRDRRDDVEEQAARLTDALGSSVVARLRSRGAQSVAIDVEKIAIAARAQFDEVDGGFGGAPKFPQAMTLSLLSGIAAQRAAHAGRDTEHATDDATDDITEVVRTSLDAMAAGGIHDHVGGGFARYSVDARWLVPHFEKMLYDQALLLRAYVHGWQLTHDDRYRRVAEGIVSYVARDLTRADGGIASSEDADSEGVEGKFYLWSIDEVCEHGGDDAAALIDFYGVTEAGNFEGANILAAVDRTAAPPDAVLRGLERLRAARAARVRPGLDDKVLLEWNALYLRSLAEAAWVFDRSDWMRAAGKTATFLLTRLRRDDGRFLRSWQEDAAVEPGWGSDGRARHLAYAADYAALLEALVTLAELADLDHLGAAEDVARALVDLFFDEDGGAFYTTGRDAPALVVRPVDVQDNATPSANSLAVNGLLRLAALSGRAEWGDPARAVLEVLSPVVVDHPLAFAYAAEAAQRLGPAAIEIVLVGEPGGREALERAVASRRIATTTIVSARPNDSERIPLLEGRTAVDRPTAYVCRANVCQLPVGDAGALDRALDAELDAARG